MASTELTILELGPKGDGVHQGSRGRIYVDRAAPGDRLSVRIRKERAGVPRGEILRVLDPSPVRQKPPCIHYDRCGNCTLQHVNEAFYRAWKIELVREALHKQSVRPLKWLEPVFLGGNNRRRATFAARKDRGGIVLGYYRRRSREIGEIDSCLVADPRLLVLRGAIRPLLGLLLTAGTTADLFLQIVGEAAELVVTGPVGRRGEPDAPVRAAVARLLATTPLVRVGWRAHENEVIETLSSKGPLTAEFGPLKVSLPPAAFLQPTREGESVLVGEVLAALPGEGRFADLFSGCGTFSGPMLTRGPVDAYESVLTSLRALAKAGAGSPLKALRRDLFRNPLGREELNRYDTVVFDPPRGGCPEQAAELAGAKTATVVGVSCNPATFARDARTLCEGGYRLRSVRIIDQFLWSHHVELVGVFSRGG